jgi:hypothetical protein
LSCNLSFGVWKEVFEETDVNVMFNSFLNIFLRYFYNSFPESYIKPYIIKNKAWISPSIKIKCSIKRHLYLISRNSKDPNIKDYYRIFSKLLSSNVIEAKCLYSGKQILNSKNRTRTLDTS